MRVIITEWALESYLNLKYKKVFEDKEYKEIIRPDVERLKLGMPFKDPKFKIGKFWSRASDKSGKPINDAYKMKWQDTITFIGSCTSRRFLPLPSIC